MSEGLSKRPAPQPSLAKLPAFLQLASAFMKEEELEGAESSAQFATLCDPKSFDAWLMLGACRAKRKHYERAIPCYLKALELRGDDVGAWCDLGEILTLLADYPRAASALRRAMELDPSGEHPSGRRARAIVGRTLSLLKKS